MKRTKGINLYKYRGGDQTIFERDLNALVNDSYWSAEIPTLNDPCEALINTEGYFKDLSTLEKTVHTIIGQDIDFGVIRSKMNGLLAKALSCGVFSLSKNYNDELMWSHYGAAHHGFCIGYNMHYMERSLTKYFYNVLEVVYSEVPPEIKMFEQIMSRDRELGMKQLLATKSMRWKNEQEIRIVTDKPGLHFYDFRAVESIYFGLRMSEVQKDRLMSALQGRDINYYQMHMAPNAYHFLAVQIADRYPSSVKYKYNLAPVMEGAVDESSVQPHFKIHDTYLKKAVEIARREPNCMEVIMSGFSFNCPIDQPSIYVHCQWSDNDYHNVTYTLNEIDDLYDSISDL